MHGKYARTETERRFLLASLPEGLGDGIVIVDHYLEGMRLRLRHLHSTPPVFKLGQKYQEPTDAPEERTMTNLYLEHHEYRFLLERLGGRRLEKRRYSQGEWCIDHHSDGKVLAEGIGPCPWDGVDVTGDPRFEGHHLAGLQTLTR